MTAITIHNEQTAQSTLKYDDSRLKVEFAAAGEPDREGFGLALPLTTYAERAERVRDPRNPFKFLYHYSYNRASLYFYSEAGQRQKGILQSQPWRPFFADLADYYKSVAMASAATVSIVGLGYMGTALARTFIKKNVTTHVWNRTFGKAQALVKAGATAHREIEDCVQASGPVVVCRADMKVFEKAFRSGSDDEEQKSGATIGRNRVMVNYTTGTPQEVRDSQQASETMGFYVYLHGTIQAYPYEVERSHANIVYSGPRESFNSLRPLLEHLGTAAFIDEDPTSAALREAALMGIYFPMVLAFIQSAALPKKARPDGTSAELYLSGVVWPFIEDSVKPSMQEIATQIDKKEFVSDGSGARLEVHAMAIRTFLKSFKEVGANDFLLHPMLEVIERRVETYNGRDEERSALFNEG